MTVADADCANGYLDNMKKPLMEGMTLMVSSWGDKYDTMSWLDNGLCSGDCNTNYTSKISNISYKTGPHPTPPPPPPPPVDYTYGDACASL